MSERHIITNGIRFVRQAPPDELRASADNLRALRREIKSQGGTRLEHAIATTAAEIGTRPLEWIARGTARLKQMRRPMYPPAR